MSDYSCGHGAGGGLDVTIPAGCIPNHKPKDFTLNGTLEVHGETKLHDRVITDKDVAVGGDLDVAGEARIGDAHVQTLHVKDIQIVTDNPDGTPSSAALLERIAAHEARMDAQDERITAQDAKLDEMDKLLGQTADIFGQIANGG